MEYASGRSGFQESRGVRGGEDRLGVKRETLEAVRRARVMARRRRRRRRSCTNIVQMGVKEKTERLTPSLSFHDGSSPSFVEVILPLLNGGRTWLNAVVRSGLPSWH